MGRRLPIMLLVGLCLLALVACGSESGSNRAADAEARATPLADLDSVLDLRAAFNRDRGSPRLLLLLAPT